MRNQRRCGVPEFRKGIFHRKPPSHSIIALQQLFLVEALQLRYDIEACLVRVASGRAGGVPYLALIGSEHAFNGFEGATNELRGVLIQAKELRAALLRVDAEMPETAVADHVDRVFSGHPAPASAPAQAEGAEGGVGGGEKSSGSADHLPLGEVCVRLFAEPLRRHSPRTNDAMCEAVSAAIKLADKGGKKGKGGGGKKGKVGGGGAAMSVSMSRLRDAITKADSEMRPNVETEFVATGCFAAARRGHQATGAPPAPSVSQPPSPGRSGKPGASNTVPMPNEEEEEAPLDALLDALRDSLLQPTSTR